ncbi:MAG TPA: ATP-binding protein [Burkholderiaceae bacterium]|nr:ATP-binding protein [Burkholderiaceae bacterium]HMY99604.1 ATP-binding protein [Burkholderiaceae bacterium]HNB45320.1 ATP-binding protein [Burkholderiaceae bacterium]HNG79344.1 ATP-binding protein [Burkholderiaceae bacterium]
MALLSLIVAAGLLWQHGEAALKLAGSELRGGLTASLEGSYGSLAELARRSRIRQATQDGPDSPAAAAAEGILSEYLQTHPAVRELWLLDDAGQVILVRQASQDTVPTQHPDPPAEVRSTAQTAMVAMTVQIGRRTDAARNELLLAQPIRFGGSSQIDGALVSTLSVDALIQTQRAGLEPSMRADVFNTAPGPAAALPWGHREVTWPIQLRSSNAGLSHAFSLRVSQPVWSTLLPVLWLAAAYGAVGAALVVLVRHRVKVQALRAVQPLQALRDAAAQVAQNGLVDIPVMSVRTLLDGGSEVQDLADCFAKMLERLFKAQAVLEETVAERTAELTQAKARLDSTLAHLADGVYSLSADRQTLLFASPPVAQLLGLDGSEQPLVQATMDRLLDAHGREELARAHRQALEQGSAVARLTLMRADGLHWLEDRMTAVRDAHGALLHIDGILRDVTERLLAERLLRDQFARLDTIFALSPDGFVSFDGQGRAAAINPAFEQLTGLSLRDLIGLDDRQFEARLAEQVLQRNPPGLAQWRPDCSGHANACVSTDVLLLRGPPQRVVVCSRRDCEAPNVSRVLHLRDITRETEVDRMKSEFLSTAAHELRTPMASIRGFTDLLMMRKFDEERTRDLLQTINRQSIWLTDMINELLDLARIEARKGNDFRLELVPLQDPARAAVESLMVPGDARRVQMVPAVGLPPARIDRQKIRQALTNVLSNAYKYSPGGGTIELTLRQRAVGGVAQVGIAVRDEGIGMTPEHARRAFDRFFRADASGNIPGTGLGLALVKEIVELHGGQVELDSRLGLGTTVTMWLPAWVEEPARVIAGVARAEPLAPATASG